MFSAEERFMIDSITVLGKQFFPVVFVNVVSYKLILDHFLKSVGFRFGRLRLFFGRHVTEIDHFQNDLPAFHIAPIKILLNQVLKLKITFRLTSRMTGNAVLFQKGSCVRNKLVIRCKKWQVNQKEGN